MDQVREECCAGMYHMRALLRGSNYKVTVVQTTNHPLGGILSQEQHEWHVDCDA